MRVSLVTFVRCGFVYPSAVTGVDPLLVLISDVFYVDDGASYTHRDISHVVVCVWGVCTDVSPLASQRAWHAFGLGHPDIFLERHPLAVGDNIKAKRAI